MKILALEFSSPLRSIAAMGGGKHGYAEETGRETKPFALIDVALRAAGLARDEIDCIVIGLGPGSNAGVRTAIAIGQGWQVARGTRLLAIGSAETVAVMAAQQGATNPVLVGLEVRQGELWVARYEILPNELPRLAEPFRPCTFNVSERRSVWRMDAGQGADDLGSPTAWPRADVLARIAVGRSEFVCGKELTPVNLRPVEFVKAAPPKFAVE